MAYIVVAYVLMAHLAQIPLGMCLCNNVEVSLGIHLSLCVDMRTLDTHVAMCAETGV